jgi:hypothetical protein
MLTFRAWLGFTAAAGSSDDPRLRFLTLSLKDPYPKRLFTAQHNGAPETELRAILSDALGAFLPERAARSAAVSSPVRLEPTSGHPQERARLLKWGLIAVRSRLISCRMWR